MTAGWIRRPPNARRNNLCWSASLRTNDNRIVNLKSVVNITDVIHTSLALERPMVGRSLPPGKTGKLSLCDLSV